MVAAVVDVEEAAGLDLCGTVGEILLGKVDKQLAPREILLHGCSRR